MMNSSIEEIKQRLDIVEVISSYTHLQKAGQNYKMCCPFHNEKTPSLVVSPVRQIWKCFGCGEGGDIFGFVMKMEGVEFPEALRILAARAGVELKKEQPQERNEKTRIYEICELAVKFYQKYLEDTTRGQEAKRYLQNRKFTEETIKSFLFGYAPKNWDALKRFLLARKYNLVEIEKSGLIVSQNIGGKSYDRFRDRVMFPILNMHGDVVGFSARQMPDDSQSSAKYINTPQTIIYDKSRILYGLDKARMEIRRQDACILVEGNADVVACHQAGFLNTVASCGTALTREQLQLIKRYTNNILLSFDMDIAGQTATQRSIDLAMSEGLNIRIVRIPAGKDPADCVNVDVELWRKALQEAKAVMDYYFDSAFLKYDKTKVEGKTAIAKDLLLQIRKITNEVEKSHYIQRLAGELKVEEKILLKEMDKVKEIGSHIPIARSQVNGKPKQDKVRILEERIVGILLLYPQLFDFISKSFKDKMFFNNDLKDFFDRLKAYYAIHQEKYDIAKAENFSAEEKEKLHLIALEIENIFDEDTDVKNEALMSLTQLRDNYRKTKIKELGGDMEAVKKIIEEMREIEG